MNKEITFKAKVIKNRYNSEDFKIYVVDVDDNIYKNIKTNKNKEYIIVGNTPNLIPDIEYSITATEEINKSFGYQYKVKNIRRDKPTDYNTSMNFFKEIITEKQAKTLLDVYPNIKSLNLSIISSSSRFKYTAYFLIKSLRKNISLKALAFPSSKLSSWLSVIFKSLSTSSLDSSILSLASLKHCPISFTLISYKIKKHNF